MSVSKEDVDAAIERWQERRAAREVVTPQDVIARLCDLTGMVLALVHEHGHASDCVCRERGLWDSENTEEWKREVWRHDGETLRFIEDATVEAIRRAVTPGPADVGSRPCMIFGVRSAAELEAARAIIRATTGETGELDEP